MSNNAREMPKYRCHKVVWALKIAEFRVSYQEDGGKPGPEIKAGIIVPEEEGYAPFDVPVAYVEKHNPQAGGYYVVYDDGYASWSPAAAFESGYTRIEE